MEISSLKIDENTLNKFYKDVLSNLCKITHSNFASLISFKEDEKFDYFNFDPAKKIEVLIQFENILQDNIVFIKSLFNKSNDYILSSDFPSKIKNDLSKIFKSEYFLCSPCNYNGTLSSIIILTRESDNFNKNEIEIVDNYSSILGFADKLISSSLSNSELEEKLIQSQKLETLGRLASGIAHDLNNLLSSIFGCLELLKLKVKEPDFLRLLENIESCSIRAKNMTKDMLSYGKPTAKQKELIEPNKLIEEIVKMAVQSIPKKINFDIDVETELFTVLGNSTQLYQVILNLIVNASESIPDKGNIILSAKNIINNNPSEQYTFLSAGNYVCFSVEDSGCGISEDNLLKIFEPYFSTKQKETGGGLGLYISYGIVQAHKGFIDVKSELGRGTKFNIYIPAIEESKIQNDYSSEKIILLADDEMMLQDLLAELLESQDYFVIKVQNGIEVLKILTEELKINLLVIDYNMPEMNGLECIEEIKKLKYYFPIILSTGENLDFSDDFLSSKGINLILNKPYDFETMLSTVKKLIG